MWNRKHRFIGLSLGIVVLLTVYMAFAQQDTNEPKACSLKKASCCSASAKPAAGCSQAKISACKASSGCGSGCAGLSFMPIYLDGPGALLAQSEKLGLTDEQKASLTRILANARKEAVAVLTDEQRAKLGDIPDKPIMACKGGAKKACGASCTKPCCANKAKAKACAPDCNKPCCAAKVKTCGPGCTKPCCANKAKACPPGCTKPCCATKSAPVEQTVCPVMGAPINQELYTEYEGKKVYFCCPGCKAKFEAEPKKYLDTLPQFKK
jgi:YHS domain-containing protein